MLPEKGRKLPIWKGVLSRRDILAETIADLLSKEHGESHRAIKQLMRQTNASERTVKHWLSAQHAPDTLFFLRLMVSSPVIRAFVLGLIESPASNPLSSASDRPVRAVAREAYAAGEAAFSALAKDAQENDPEDGPNRDPEHDPELVELNERQHWFLERIVDGDRCGAKEIMAIWQVSLKTARRDIRGLQLTGVLTYVGSRRRGRYRSVR
ncbi:DeoR family transcriptional regulator [Agrobacterium rhizogenes]|nr:DeoR family transcriptional regulator [Rhizobium rhizogenes]NTG55878.1 DeoR family transcriptional regulator [Rhizobium rhizogenes]NTH01790.1 DeoR family transcriptional regulator [Rhizobium rhizogenes]NTI57501.1 DeoR family transcriptional regulator [Rhizobium rhizogenes]